MGMIRYQAVSDGRTDEQTDRRTDRRNYNS